MATEYRLVYIDPKTGDAVSESHIFTTRAQLDREVVWCQKEGYGYHAQRREVGDWEDDPCDSPTKS